MSWTPVSANRQRILAPGFSQRHLVTPCDSVVDTPAPSPTPPDECADEKRTRGQLNSCHEQEKCFSISYKEVEDPHNECNERKCNIKWKVCIDINKNNPCCNKKRKKAFQRACVRGNDLYDTCLNNDISIEEATKISPVKFEEEYCEIVSPGEDAIFLLVSFESGSFESSLMHISYLMYIFLLSYRQ